VEFLNIHTHKFSNQENILEIVNQYPKEFVENLPNYSIGIHPWYINESSLSDDLKIIEQKLILSNCLALGECGLDKRIEIAFDLQIKVLEEQLKLAIKHQKPIIIHCVAAFQEIIEIKKKLNINLPIIVHGFSKNIETANQLIDNGFYLSFGKYLLQNPELESVFKAIPNNRFFLETDTIDNKIEEVYKLAANYKNIELENLKAIINTNFEKVFNSYRN
jgi:TatD DNase family protein